MTMDSARRNPHRSAIFVATAGLCLASWGCGPSARELGRRAFYRHDYETAQKLFAENKDRADRNFVLYNLEWGSAAFEGGDYRTARRAFETAAQVMRGYEGTTEGIVSLVANESAKLFKGDPFERAMANFYDGLIYYRWGDYGNARAAFHQALMADKSSADGYQEDFAIAQFMIGKCYRKIGEPDNARISFEKARKAYPHNPYFSDGAARDHNVLIILQLGTAPKKIATGLAGSLDDYARGSYRETGAKVYANGRLLGESSRALDLFHQAKTSGRTAKDAIQTAKGAAKTGLLAAAAAENDSKRSLALAAAALLMPAQADLRQWDLLPGEIHLVSARLPPGRYTFKIEFFAQGKPMSDFRQVWHYVPVEEDRDTLLVFRSGRHKANGHMPPRQNPVFRAESDEDPASAPQN